MATLLEYKCPNCGGALSFDSDTQKMNCPYCDSELEIDALRELDEALNTPAEDQMTWDSQPQTQWQADEQAQLAGFICQSCGGEIICDENTAATSCPYCGNPVVMSGRLSGVLRPDLVIPFQLDKEAAVQALTNHISKRKLLPKVFKDENHIREIKGIYVPFWLFDADADGDVHYRATRVHTWSDSNYYYTKTKHYSVRRVGRLSFAGVPVDGSTKMPDALMESIEPFDFSKAVDFQAAYLAGFLADKYDVSAEDSISRANDRIRVSTNQALEQTVVGYTTVSTLASTVKLENGKVRYALYPVWLLNTRYKEKDYQFAMNGQTGKFVGNLPIDWGRFFAWWGGIAGSAGVVLWDWAGWLGSCRRCGNEEIADNFDVSVPCDHCICRGTSGG